MKVKQEPCESEIMEKEQEQKLDQEQEQDQAGDGGQTGPLGE
jgi:hypothetical protein